MSFQKNTTFWVLGMFILLGLSSLGYLLSDAAIRVKEYERTVTVKGLSEREYPADIVIWPIRFTEAGNDLTALMWAAGHSNDVPEAEGLVTVEALLAAGAPVGPADNRGRTALMIAAGRGHPAIAARLIAVGADPDARDNEGKTAADLAANDEVRAVVAGAD